MGAARIAARSALRMRVLLVPSGTFRGLPARPSLMVSKRLQVLHDVVELLVRDLLLRERGHRTDPLPDLEPLEERGERFVVQGGAESRLATRVALVAVLHVRGSALLSVTRQHERAHERLAPSCLSATQHGGSDDHQEKGAHRSHRAPVRVILHSTPVSLRGSGPRSVIVITPKSTT